MAENKTQRTTASVQAFLNTIEEPQKRQDAQRVMELMREVTGSEPEMWGDKIVGFGRAHYKYASGREGEWFHTGFSPRKQNLTLYLNYGFDGDEEQMARLGKHTTGKACLYIKRLSDVDLSVLRQLIAANVKRMTRPRSDAVSHPAATHQHE
jgi:hypothetical protein